jgi:hypothetical protein
MATKIAVPAVERQRTHIGKVTFPTAVPQGIVEHIRFPEDFFAYTAKLGLDERASKFIIAALSGKWSITASAELPAIAAKTGMSYAEMDEIVRDLMAKNYAALGSRLDLFKLWVCLLHLTGIRFVAE